ncbi:hypothetical protein Tco_0973730 [Tanacetum coccineum]
MPTKPSGIADLPSLDADLAPTDSETESGEEVPGINAGDQDEGQAGPNHGVQDKDQTLELSFTNHFLEEKPQEDEPEKTNIESEVQSDTKQLSSEGKVEQTWDPAIKLEESQHSPEDKSYLAHEDHKNLFEALEKSLERDHSNQLLTDLEEARRKKRKKRASPRTPFGSPPSQPPPPPPPVGASGAPGTSGASGSSQLPPPPPPSSTGTSGSAQQQGSKAPSSSKTAASTPQSMA